MAFDISSAKPVQAKQGSFDLSTAKPAQGQPVYAKREGDFIPTSENLAAAEAARIPKEDRSISDVLVGAGETALTLATGATGGAAGFISAVPEAIVGELSGRLKQGEGLQEASQRASDFTYAPKTEAGQEYTGVVGEALGSLPPVLASTPMFGTKGLPKVERSLLSKSQSPLAKAIAEKAAGNVKKKFTKKLAQDRFSPKMYAKVKEARKQGFDDGMTTVIANSSPTDKRRMSQQVSILERGFEDTLYQQKNRPADVAGNSMLRKVEFIRDNNKKAGLQLGQVAKRLKGKEVDLSGPMSKFESDLRDIGVTVGDDGVLNFEGSRIRTIAPAKKIIQDTFDEINLQGDMDALKAHEFKGFLDENINFGKRQDGLSGKAERITQDLRRGVNEAIGEGNPKYQEANKRFSDTITILNELEDVVGKKLNIDGPYADKAFGTALRGLMNNTKGRANLMSVTDKLDDISRKYGGDFDDDLLTQMLFADELDAVFGGGARTSLKGEFKKANIESAIDLSQMSIPGALAVGAKAGVKKARGINEKNQLKAIKKLLSTK